MYGKVMKIGIYEGLYFLGVRYWNSKADSTTKSYVIETTHKIEIPKTKMLPVIDGEGKYQLTDNSWVLLKDLTEDDWDNIKRVSTAIDIKAEIEKILKQFIVQVQAHNLKGDHRDVVTKGDYALLTTTEKAIKEYDGI